MRAPVLVAGTDGVGTKLKIAFDTGRHDTVGIDCVAMCVNDIICHGARPLFFLDYIGSGKLDQKIALAIVKGVARGCAQAGMSLVGGETAQLPRIVQARRVRSRRLRGGNSRARANSRAVRVRAGDVLIGLASSGLHSNGFSLVRHVLLERAKLKLKLEHRRTGMHARRGTPASHAHLRADVVVELFERFKINGLANITGGGVIENLPRVMPENTRAILERGSWPTPPIFDLHRAAWQNRRAEMDRTFNNGLGMVAIVPAREADRVVAHLRRREYGAYVVGEVRRGKRGVSIR